MPTARYVRRVNWAIAAVVLLWLGGAEASAQSAGSGEKPLQFMGHDVTVTDPGVEDPDGFFPRGPASVCVELAPKRQCYTAPKEFGRFPKAVVTQIEKNQSAILFSASSGGVSGYGIHFALLRPGAGGDLEDFFKSGISLSSQSEHAFWSEPSISGSKIFVTADYVWGPDESHYQQHRFIVSTYVRRPSSMVDGLCYYLEDQFMTVRKYDLEESADILKSERQEILALLRRIRMEEKRIVQAPTSGPPKK